VIVVNGVEVVDEVVCGEDDAEDAADIVLVAEIEVIEEVLTKVEEEVEVEMNIVDDDKLDATVDCEGKTEDVEE
jgi:hypothetical protein